MASSPWGMAALRAEDNGEIRVDMLNIFKRAAPLPGFAFHRNGYQIIGYEWIGQMRDHLRRCSRSEWPPTPACGYWFKSLFVYATGATIKADVATFIYENRDPEPLLTWQWAQVMDDFVRGGSLLVEGDVSGMQRIDAGSAEFAFLPDPRAHGSPLRVRLGRLGCKIGPSYPVAQREAARHVHRPVGSMRR
jgi:hypothetical protein